MYLLLYVSIFLMLTTSILVLAVPFIKTRSLSSHYFLLPALFIILFSLSLYLTSNNSHALKQWLTEGEKHYRLQQEVNALGGIEGMIARIKHKLAENPRDAEGWFILGKLYFADQRYDAAKEAFGKAHELRPEKY